MDLGQLKPLQERAKELKCIYDIEETLRKSTLSFSTILNQILEIIPTGWQFPAICIVKIEIDNQKYVLPSFIETKWSQSADIIVDNNIVGDIKVFYTSIPFENDPFLPDEQRLLNTIAYRLGQYLFYNRLVQTVKLLSQETNNEDGEKILKRFGDEHWKWRFRMAQTIADKTDFEYYGVYAIYLIGSTKETNAGPASDIDLLVQFDGTENQLELFKSWINGWSFSLAELNHQKTGYKMENGIIDLHIITQKEIDEQNSFAVMISNLYNSARLLRKK